MLFHVKQATINFTGCADSPSTCQVYSKTGSSWKIPICWLIPPPPLMSLFQRPGHKNIAGICSANLVTAFPCEAASPAINSHSYCPPRAACWLPALSCSEWSKGVKQTGTRVMTFAAQPQHWARIGLMDRCGMIFHSIFFLTVYQLKEQKACQNGSCFFFLCLFFGRLCLPICHRE